MKWAAVLAACVVLALAPGATARTLIVNANGYTVGADGDWERFGALLVGDDGRVLQLFGAKEKTPKPEKGDFRFDAGGRTLVPGLIDSHIDLVAAGLAQRMPDLSDIRTPADLERVLTDAVKRLPPEAWLVARGLDPDALPDAHMLDSVTGARPAWIVAAGGHFGVANSAALAAAGIDAATQPPPGGRIAHDAEGRPTGVLAGTALALIDAVRPAPTAGEREKALAAILALLPQHGVTTVADMGVTPADWALLRAFADDRRLTLRVVGYAAGTSAMDVISPLRPTPWLYQGRLRLAGVYIDGENLIPESDGGPLPDEAKLKNLISRANFLGYQAAVRAVGVGANRQLLDAYAEIVPGYGKAFRNRVEHVQLSDPADIERFASLGLVASFQPWHAAEHAAEDAQLAGQNEADTWLETGCMAACLARAGIRLALGSGAPDAPLGLAYGATPLSAADTLRGWTADAAYALRAEDDLGRLAKGQQADFVILDRDPFAEEDAGAWRVLETWIGGKRVFVAGKETPGDQEGTRSR